MAVDIDALQIQIEAESGPASKNLGSLVDCLERMKTAVKGNGSDLTTLSKRLAILNSATQGLSASSKKLGNLAAVLKNLSGLNGISIPKALPDRLLDLGAAMDLITPGAIANLDNMTKSLQRLSGVNLKGVSAAIRSVPSAGLNGLSAAIRSIAGSKQEQAEGGEGAADARAGEQMESVTQKASILKSALAGIKSAASSAKAGLKDFSSAITSISDDDLSRFNAGLKAAGSYVVSDFTKPLANAVSTVKKWKNSFGRIAFYRTIRAAIAAVTSGFNEGNDNLYQYSRLTGTEFAPAMDSLATSALYLKNSLGAMAAPLIQEVAPAVDYLVDKFVNLLNVIGKTLAALTGKSTYTQAVKYTTEYAEAANGAAEAMNGVLLGFDEMNVLARESGSGSGSALDYGSMFEEVEVPIEAADWAERIRQAIEDGDWYSAGVVLADKLNSILDSWDAYAWGASLGEKINSGLSVAYGFMTTFDFERLGSEAAGGLNGILDTVDWDLLGRTFASKWNALIDMLYGFVTTFEWVKFGKAISDAVNGWFDEIDWVKAAQAISTGVKGALASASTALEETDFYEIGRSIGEFIINIDWVGILGGAANVIADALLGVFQVAFGLVAEGITGDGESILGNALSIAAGGAVALVTVSYLTGLLKTIGTKLSKLSATKKTLASAVLIAIEFSVSEWTITEFLDTGDWKNILLDALSVSAGSFLLYKTLGAKGLILGVAVGLVANITSLTGEIASGLKWNNWKALITEAVTTTMGAAGGSIGLSMLGFTWAEGAKIGLAVTLAAEIAAINASSIASGAWDANSWQPVVASIASTIAAGFGGYVLAGAVFGAAAGPVGLAIGIGVGVIVSILSVAMGKEAAYKNSEFYQQLETWKSQAEETMEFTKQIQVNIETRYSEYSEIENEYAAYIGILDEIFRLDEIPEKSAEQLSLMSGYVDIINGLNLDGLYLTFDETTKKIVETKDSVYGVIDALMAQAKMEAAYDYIVQIYKDKNKALLELQDAENGLSDATALVAEKQEIYNTALAEYTSAAANATRGSGGQREGLAELRTTMEEANRELGDATEKQQALQEAFDSVQGEIEDLDVELALYQNQLIELQGTTDGVASEMDSAFTGLPVSWGSSASLAAEALRNGIVPTISALTSDADTWGSDICSNIANGIEKNIKTVTAASRSLANNVRSYLAFSEPDIGPLSDFHTYMPDMLKLMAQGIRDNAYLAVNAASSLAGSISDTIGNLSPEEDIQFPIHEAAFTWRGRALTGREYGDYGGDNGSAEFASNIRESNVEMISAVVAGIQRIVDAINEKDGNVYIGDKVVGQAAVNYINGQAKQGNYVLAGSV